MATMWPRFLLIMEGSRAEGTGWKVRQHLPVTVPGAAGEEPEDREERTEHANSTVPLSYWELDL